VKEWVLKHNWSGYEGRKVDETKLKSDVTGKVLGRKIRNLQEKFSPEEEEEIRQIIREELPYIFYKLYLRRKSWTKI